MKLFAKSYFNALFAVLLAMGAYRLVVVTAIDPGVKPAIAVPEFTGVLGSEKWWLGLFAEKAWQVDKPIIIQNGRGVLLANTWEQIGPKTFKLKPLSMILPQSSDSTHSAEGRPSNSSEAFGEQDVWIVDAAAGAIIHFEEPFDLTSGGVPAIERGQLDGAITITRRSVTKREDKPWRLHTSDLSIDRRRISTQQAVTMQWGNSLIRGRDLRVMLRRDVLGGKGSMDDPSGWGPLDELELYHVEEFKVELPLGGLWAGVSPSLLASGTPPLAHLPATLEAFCGGRFAFDFKQSLATMTNGVHIRHQLAQLPPDEFLSHKISIKVDPPDKQAVGASGVAVSGISMGGFKIREVIALGIDSVQDYVGEKWVELKSPTLGAAARGKRLRINLDRQRIELAGKLDQPSATQSIAWLNYQGSECRSPSVAYEASPSGEDGKPLHAGWMVADGPGELTTSDGSGVGESQVRWQQSLTMEPAQKLGEQKVELLGKTLVENKLQGFMAADRLQLWLRKNLQPPTLTVPVAKVVSTARSPDPSEASAASGVPDTSAAETPSYLLDRIVATGNTTLSAGDIKAHVDTMLVNLVYVPASDPQEPQGLQLSDSLGNPMYQYVGPPGATSAPAARSGSELFSPVAAMAGATQRGKPVTIHGTALNATVLSAGEQNWVDALTVQGPLKIQSDAAAETHRGDALTSATPLAWHIEGEQLKLASNSAGQVDIQIDGRPARVVMAEGALEGPVIRLDQRHNLVWMDQPGEFTLPISALNWGGITANALQWSKPPHCTWAGRLLFDGSIIHIEGDIQLDGVVRRPDQLWMLQGFCQRLDVTLSEPIDMRQGNSPGNSAAPTVARIILQDNVDLRMAQTDLLGNRQSLERIVVPILTYHVAEQQWVGGGPGWINSKFLGEKPTEPTNAAIRLSSAADAKPVQLRGAHLSFRDNLVAFIDRSEVVFSGKVEVASGPLKNWDDTINLAKLTQLAVDQMLLNCDQLKVYDTSRLSSTASLLPAGQSGGSYNFQALGNVVFEGRAETDYYSGNGYRLTYEQAKDQLIIVGDGRTPALLRKSPTAQPRDGSSPQGTVTGHVNSATLNMRTMAIVDLQASEVRYDLQPPEQAAGQPASPNLPTMNTPNPRAGVSNFLQPRK